MQKQEYEDISPWAVHFTTPDRMQPSEEPLREGWIDGLVDFLERRRLADATGYENSMSILGRDSFARSSIRTARARTPRKLPTCIGHVLCLRSRFTSSTA
jgi:hypothetical protein